MANKRIMGEFPQECAVCTLEEKNFYLAYSLLPHFTCNLLALWANIGNHYVIQLENKVKDYLAMDKPTMKLKSTTDCLTFNAHSLRPIGTEMPCVGAFCRGAKKC